LVDLAFPLLYALVEENFGGGPTFIGGDLGDHVATGWGPAIGVTVDASERLGFQFEYAYRRFDIKDDAPFFGATAFSANHQTHQLDFNIIANLAPSGSAVRPNVMAGPGGLQPRGRDHGIRRQRHHLRPVLVCVRRLPGHRRGGIARRLGLRVQRRRRRRVRDW
jgi:hypothetical protein